MFAQLENSLSEKLSEYHIWRYKVYLDTKVIPILFNKKKSRHFALQQILHLGRNTLIPSKYLVLHLKIPSPALCHLNTWKTEAGGSWVQGQPEIHSKPLPKTEERWRGGNFPGILTCSCSVLKGSCSARTPAFFPHYYWFIISTLHPYSPSEAAGLSTNTRVLLSHDEFLLHSCALHWISDLARESPSRCLLCIFNILSFPYFYFLLTLKNVQDLILYLFFLCSGWNHFSKEP